MTYGSPTFGIPSNILECINAYEHSCDSQKFTSFKSTIFRFTLPGLGLPLPKGKRMTPNELEAARKFAAELPLSSLHLLPEAQKKTFEMLQASSNLCSKHRIYLKEFLDWVSEKKWIAQKVTDDKKKLYRFSGERHDRIQRKKLTNRKALRKFSLSFEVSDYLTEEDENQKEIIQFHLDRIGKELKEFEMYLRGERGYQKTSLEVRYKSAIRFLGWLYEANKVPLEKLSLESFIEVVHLKFSMADFPKYQDYYYAKGLAQEKAKEVADSTVKKLEELFEWLENKPTPGTKQTYTESAIAIASFLYRNETDVDYANLCEDIPVVRRLRVYCNKIEKQKRNSPPDVPYHEKAVTWEQVLMVVERLRYEADATHTDSIVKGEHKRKKRPIKARAASLMNFLLVALFTVVPPDRQRTYRELRLGETLKHGIYHGEMFIPREKMINPQDAKFFIHLLPDQYKTGKAYKEWIGELPNLKYPDGKTFYQYLEKWLYCGYKKDGVVKGLREVLNPKDHNYVFFGKITGEPIEVEGMTKKVASVFERMTGVPVSPHTLRKIFRSYIKEKGASPEELESAAYWMKHDLRTAEKDYTFLDCQSKLKAGTALAERINSEILKKVTINA
jgi:hypothetical protein